MLPSKFLLGGNIRDPLNLNSLSDEKISKIVNAITPESSPLPTPKHRRAEYKIEVLIPPNISDPLNLNAAVEEGEYEAQLVATTRPATRQQQSAATASTASAGVTAAASASVTTAKPAAAVGAAEGTIATR